MEKGERVNSDVRRWKKEREGWHMIVVVGIEG